MGHGRPKISNPTQNQNNEKQNQEQPVVIQVSKPVEKVVEALQNMGFSLDDLDLGEEVREIIRVVVVPPTPNHSN